MSRITSFWLFIACLYESWPAASVPITLMADVEASIPSTCGRESVLCPRSLTTVSEELELEELISFTINPEVKEKSTVTPHIALHIL